MTTFCHIFSGALVSLWRVHFFSCQMSSSVKQQACRWPMRLNEENQVTGFSPPLPPVLLSLSLCLSHTNTHISFVRWAYQDVDGQNETDWGQHSHRLTELQDSPPPFPSFQSSSSLSLSHTHTTPYAAPPPPPPPQYTHKHTHFSCKMSGSVKQQVGLDADDQNKDWLGRTQSQSYRILPSSLFPPPPSLLSLQFSSSSSSLSLSLTHTHTHTFSSQSGEHSHRAAGFSPLLPSPPPFLSLQYSSLSLSHTHARAHLSCMMTDSGKQQDVESQNETGWGETWSQRSHISLLLYPLQSFSSRAVALTHTYTHTHTHTHTLQCSEYVRWHYAPLHASNIITHCHSDCVQSLLKHFTSKIQHFTPSL